MKLLGLLGGMSWESTQRYYQLINEGVRDALGGLHSANLLIRSFDFEGISELQAAGSWDAAATLLGREAKFLESAGVDQIMICTNTMHCIAEEVMQDCAIPLMHIGDVVGEACQQRSYAQIGLLGTCHTMELPFLRNRLEENFGLTVLIPEEQRRKDVHRVIYEELCQGRVLKSSTELYKEVIEDLAKRGAEAVVFGCTEIEMLFRDDEPAIPAIDTMKAHADAAVRYLIST